MRRINFEDTTVTKQPYVIIDDTEYEVQDGTYDGGTDLNANTFNTMQNNIEEAIDEKQNVELLAVTNIAPSECTIGDKYYNTDDNLIYISTATNTWSDTGEEPISGIFYIVFDEQSSYSYDGNTLVSVGGGIEDIIISDTEPTEDGVKIWIDTGEISNRASEITNSYSTSTGIGYSANYVNTNVEPKGVVIYDGLTKYANDIMTIPQEYKKLDVYCYSYVNAPAKNIISIDTSTNSTQFTTGAVFALPDAYFVEIELILKTNRTLRADYCATYPNFASNVATTRNNDNNFYVYKIVGYK